ncbi:electron transport complex subunit RnfC [Clostridium saccharobutylicum]|uniref:electron transport complex subunit RsxC n=1 Tax=Clostridium saccharobutylicum TaxID=169679 RepID=UPI000983F781|nr:electron transport complex subunit RsxC [Clostridium saccharobutylicum]AQS08474.1 electron transport complex subunit RnfC [Clostridium saccharobutylicum]MBC2438346.1 electron transport complex subunit RsxC [Clostridium saccharobutylicum]NSB89482.1 electron transport complex protein RnfC [Clostridium saccharobutylicum]NYC29187.1 electron transport complex protein RnfC [Clostridium saccharobutylicum]OOM15484.1 electron transport complex subunit RnfC [Clostridium saccharobutylicum]
MLKSFLGGIHPNDSKKYTFDKAIESPSLPDEVVIPVSQHIGAPCTPIVKVGDSVKKGQVIANSDAFMHSPIHASISGKVTKIADMPHASKGSCLSIVIKNDGLDEWIEGIPLNREWDKLNAEEIRNIIKDAGIVGMGGATFPTHIKLNPSKDKKIDVCIVNAAECEPYLTADYRMMLEYADHIVTGVKIIMKVLGVTKVFIGIEDNKMDAVKVMKDAFKDTSVEVVPLPTKYPQGAEKMLIKVLTGREVPSGGLPMDVGVVVQNVGTTVAISDAVVNGIPLIQRITTVSGDAIKEPKNLLLRIGTSFKYAINYCGGFSKDPEKIIMGGPMMGFAQSTLDVPVIKGVSGILALSSDVVNSGEESPCIRCGRCVKACPMGLIPSMLSILGQRHKYKEAKENYNLFNCIECGSCVYSCPAKRNIVQYIKYSKAQNLAHAANK